MVIFMFLIFLYRVDISDSKQLFLVLLGLGVQFKSRTLLTHDSIQKPPVVKEEDEPEEEEEDELGHAETYAEYMPQKCKYYCFKSKNQSFINNETFCH